MFVDKARIKIKAGDGGDGAVSFHREKYVAAGGPDGGDGGKGGDIIFQVDDNFSTLIDFRYKRKYMANKGEDGSANNCTGKNAEPLIIKVPRGTLIKDAETGRIMADMSSDEPCIVAKGGKGGKGNVNFATSTRQIPKFAKPGFIGEEFDTKVEIVENGVRYMVDVKDGQKTGFFLDQKYNRLAIQRLCKDAEVLDCFTHTGSFALNAGIAGAKHVTGVDASELGIEQARENARLNGLEDRVEFVCADVFDLLPKLEEEGKQYDVVILDPPAFTKSRKTIKNATKGYREINMRGMKLVKPGGYLATCSCSHFMDYELFTKTIHQAAQNVHKRVRQVEYRTQAPDHPILWSAEESYYLKFYVFQIVDEK